ncbi:MAG: DoxX family protein [Cyclobacteriaceae bacterium]|nr:DoxX family protein [Cyclobacteriaceae bacterium]
MKTSLFGLSESLSPLLLRAFLSVVIMAHGAQKLFGWFGGYGFEGTMGYFTDTVGLPWALGLFIILLEFFGALMLLLGVTTRFLSALFVGLAAGIVFSTHLPNGFFMNWFGNQAGEGYEFFLLWVGMAISLITTGGGRWSVDYYLQKSKVGMVLVNGSVVVLTALGFCQFPI